MLHKYKYEKKYGALLPCFVLHHIDGDKLNNRLNNLQPLAQRQHAALHLEI
ncbi:MAG: HNH endonuclease [Holosporaceae bacterium]|nr:HNH endonuclease [Holosporaceae bacterium]